MKDSLSSTNIYKVEQEKEYLRSSIRKKFKRLVEHAVYDLLKCKPKNKYLNFNLKLNRHKLS